MIARAPCIPAANDSIIEMLESGKEYFALDRPAVQADTMRCGLKVLSVPLSSLAA
jgi:hypothetical protein